MAGDILRNKREALGLEIKPIAEQLRIKPEYLSSIEQDLFDKLPAPVYTMGYIRSYARHLDVDPTAILAVYAERLPKPKTDNSAIPVVLAEKKRPWFLYLFLALVTAGLAAGLYLYLPPELLQQAAPGVPQITAAPQQTETRPAPMPQHSAPVVTPTPREPAPRPAEQSAPVLPAAAAPEKPEPRRPASGQPGHLLVVQAAETSWIYVKFNNGTYESVTLRAGTSRQWNFSEGAFLKIGNAGGIKILLDDRDLGPLGRPGQVVTLNLP